MTRSRSAGAALAAAMVAGCATLDSAEHEADRLLKRDQEWAAVAAEGTDVERIVSFWSDDATVFPAGAPAIKGKAAIREYVKESLAIPGFSIRWNPQSVVVSQDGTMGYTTGENQVTVPGPDGKIMTIPGRYITVWQRDSAGEWRCVVDLWNSGSQPGP